MKGGQGSISYVHQRKGYEYGYGDEHGNAASVVKPFSDMEANASQQHLRCDQKH